MQAKVIVSVLYTFKKLYYDFTYEVISTLKVSFDTRENEVPCRERE